MQKFLLAIVLFSVAVLFSCEKTPECETNHYGYVRVVNQTGVNFYVDVTYPGSDYNNEAYLSPGSSYTYTMTSGEVTVWGTDYYGYLDNVWWYDYMYVYDCETSTYTWYAKKSTERPTFDKKSK